MDGLNDKELVLRAGRGDNAAFDELVRRHFSTVYAVALARLRRVEAAEDLAQEVFLRIFLNLASLHDGARFGAWAVRLARNLAVDWQRRGKVRSEVMTMIPMDDEAHQVPDHQPNPRQAAMSDQERRHMEEAIWQLPEAQREMVLLHFMEGMTRKDIADRLGVHPATVGRQLDMALAKVRETMESQNRFHDALATRRANPRAMRRAAALATVLTAMAPDARAAVVAQLAHDAGTAKVAVDAAAATGFSLAGFLQSLGGLAATGGTTMGATKLAVCSMVAAGVIGGGMFVAKHSGPDFEQEVAKLTAPGGPLEWVDVDSLPTQDYVPDSGIPLNVTIPNRTAERINYHITPDETVQILMANDDGVLAIAVSSNFGFEFNRHLEDETVLSQEGWVRPPQMKDGKLVFSRTEFLCMEKHKDGSVSFHHETFDYPDLEQEINTMMKSYSDGTARIKDIAAKAEKSARGRGAGPADPTMRERYYKALNTRVIQSRWFNPENM